MTFPVGYGPQQRLAALDKLKFSAQALDRELFHFWLKAFFFGGFAALALLGYAIAGLAHAPLGQVFTAAAGLFIMVCWIVVVSASRFAQSVWEARVRLLEDYSIGPLLKVDEGMGRRHPLKSGMNFSVPVLMMVFCFVLAAAFGALLLYAVLDVFHGFWRPAVAVIVVLFFGAASLAALRLARSGAREVPFGLGDNVRYLDLP